MKVSAWRVIKETVGAAAFVALMFLAVVFVMSLERAP